MSDSYLRASLEGKESLCPNCNEPISYYPGAPQHICFQTFRNFRVYPQSAMSFATQMNGNNLSRIHIEQENDPATSIKLRANDCDDCKESISNDPNQPPHICGQYSCRLCYKYHSVKWNAQRCTHPGFTRYDRVNVKFYPCYNCGNVYASQAFLDKHICHYDRDGHYISFHNLTSFKCNTCGQQMSSLPLFIEHSNRHLKASVPLKTSSESSQSVNPNQSGKKYSCTLCPQSFVKKSDRDSHLHSHSRPSTLCKDCGQFFRSTMILSKHTQVHWHDTVFIPQGPFKCPDCGMLNRTTAQYNNHRKICCYKKCSVCGQTFTDLRKFDSHVESHQVHVNQSSTSAAITSHEIPPSKQPAPVVPDSEPVAPSQIDYTSTYEPTAKRPHSLPVDNKSFSGQPNLEPVTPFQINYASTYKPAAKRPRSLPVSSQPSTVQSHSEHRVLPQIDYENIYAPEAEDLRVHPNVNQNIPKQSNFKSAISARLDCRPSSEPPSQKYNECAIDNQSFYMQPNVNLHAPTHINYENISKSPVFNTQSNSDLYATSHTSYDNTSLPAAQKSRELSLSNQFPDTQQNLGLQSSSEINFEIISEFLAEELLRFPVSNQSSDTSNLQWQTHTSLGHQHLSVPPAEAPHELLVKNESLNAHQHLGSQTSIHVAENASVTAVEKLHVLPEENQSFSEQSPTEKIPAAIEVVDTPTPEPSYSCMYCNSSFSTNENLERHFETHLSL